MAIRGTRSALRDGQWLPRRFPITVERRVHRDGSALPHLFIIDGMGVEWCTFAPQPIRALLTPAKGVHRRAYGNA